MKIAICDDDIALGRKLEGLISKLDYDSEIFLYTDGKELINSTTKYDVAFLDIEVGDIHGFDIAKSVSKNNPNCIITFVSSYNDFAVEGYEYKAFLYIVKNMRENVILRKIKETIAEHYRLNKVLKITYKEEMAVVPVRDILWIESRGHTLSIKTEKSTYFWCKSLSELEDELRPNGIIRCHRSYMASMSKVDRIEGKYLIMENFGSVPISRSYMARVKKSYTEMFS